MAEPVLPTNQGPPERQEFYRRLFKFHRDRGTEVSKLPVLGKREVCLWELYNRVKTRGGIRAVILERRWPDIVRLMPLPPTCTNAGFSLKILYQKYLLDYERVFEYGLPDIPPPEPTRGGMPMPDYPPENVAMLDPHVDEPRSGKKSKRGRDEADDETPRAVRAATGAAAALAPTTPASPPRGPPGPSLNDVRLLKALTRLELSLAAVDDDANVDWALSVLLIQTQKKLPVLAKDPTGRILNHLVTLLERCTATQDDPLVGTLFNAHSLPGSARRQRLAVVLYNAQSLDEHRRLMSQHGGLVRALLECLNAVPAGADNDPTTRANLAYVLDALADGVHIASPAFARSLLVAVRGLADSAVGLSLLAKFTRRPENLALIAPLLDAPLVDRVVLALGNSLMLQSELPGSDAGLATLELALEFLCSCAADRTTGAPLLAQTPVVRLLVMFLLAALDQSAPRAYLALFRKSISLLHHLLSYEGPRFQLLPYAGDLLKIACSKSVLAPDVAPLLQAL